MNEYTGKSERDLRDLVSIGSFFFNRFSRQ